MKEQDQKLLKLILWNIYLHNNLVIGGVIDYSDFGANIIKFSTQSLFSHINFFDEYSNFAIWADKKKWVSIMNYFDNNDTKGFYYFTKKINLDYLCNIFSFEYIENVFLSLGFMNQENILSFRKRYKQYSKLRRKKSKFKIFQMMYDNDFDYNRLNVKINNYSVGSVKYLWEFLVLWIIKFIKKNFKKKYALWNTLTIGFNPWNLWEQDETEFFCSEFIAAALLYSWVYPFDIKTKDPKSLTPGDIIDLSSLFCDEETKLYKIYQNNFELLLNPSDMKEVKNIKTYIFEKEMQSFMFRYTYVRYNFLRSIFLWIWRFKDYFLYQFTFTFIVLFLLFGSISSFLFEPSNNIVSFYKAEIFDFQNSWSFFLSLMAYWVFSMFFLFFSLYVFFEFFAFFYTLLKSQKIKELDF